MPAGQKIKQLKKNFEDIVYCFTMEEKCTVAEAQMITKITPKKYIVNIYDESFYESWHLLSELLYNHIDRKDNEYLYELTLHAS